MRGPRTLIATPEHVGLLGCSHTLGCGRERTSHPRKNHTERKNGSWMYPTISFCHRCTRPTPAAAESRKLTCTRDCQGSPGLRVCLPPAPGGENRCHREFSANRPLSMGPTRSQRSPAAFAPRRRVHESFLPSPADELTRGVDRGAERVRAETQASPEARGKTSRRLHPRIATDVRHNK